MFLLKQQLKKQHVLVAVYTICKCTITISSDSSANCQISEKTVRSNDYQMLAGHTRPTPEDFGSDFAGPEE